MAEDTVNPRLRLSSEVGYEDENRADQIRGAMPFDWRDWLSHSELRDLPETEAIPLAKSRLDDIAAAEDLYEALIEFKLTVMEVRVSHEQAFSRN